MIIIIFVCLVVHVFFLIPCITRCIHVYAPCSVSRQNHCYDTHCTAKFLDLMEGQGTVALGHFP